MASGPSGDPGSKTLENKVDFPTYIHPENVNHKDKFNPRLEYPGMCLNFFIPMQLKMEDNTWCLHQRHVRRLFVD